MMASRAPIAPGHLARRYLGAPGWSEVRGLKYLPTAINRVGRSYHSFMWGINSFWQPSRSRSFHLLELTLTRSVNVFMDTLSGRSPYLIARLKIHISTNLHCRIYEFSLTHLDNNSSSKSDKSCPLPTSMRCALCFVSRRK